MKESKAEHDIKVQKDKDEEIATMAAVPEMR